MSKAITVFQESRSDRNGFVRRKIRREVEKYLWSRAMESSSLHSRKIAVFAHDLIGHSINIDGIYERRELECLFSFLAPIMPVIGSGTCLDVGANIGNHTLYFAQRFSDVRSFEPNPEVFDLLSFNVRGLPSVTVERIGLSEESAEATLTEVEGNVGASSLVGDHDGRVVPVRLEPMDKVALGLNVTFVKIDTEGYEMEVLKGGRHTINNCQPLIVFEQLKSEFTEGTTPAISFLTGIGYRICWMDWDSKSVSNPARKVLARAFEAFAGRRYKISCGAAVPVRTHPILIAVPPRYCAALNIS